MYSTLQRLCERLLRIPPPPVPPPGDENKTRIFNAAPNYYRYLLAVWALKTVGLIFAVVVSEAGMFVGAYMGYRRGGSGSEWALVAMIFLALAFIGMLVARLFALAVVRLDFDKRWYVVTDRSLRVREGIFQVREATVTFANIQNISISEGPVQRMLGIADLRVDTAGGGGGAKQKEHGTNNMHTTWFRGVNNASEIRELMQRRLNRLKDSGLGDHDDLPQSATAVSSGMLDALREVCAEAKALREVAQARAVAR